MKLDKRRWNEGFPKYKYKQYIEDVEDINYKEIGYLSHLCLYPVFLGNQLLRIIVFPFFIIPG